MRWLPALVGIVAPLTVVADNLHAHGHEALHVRGRPTRAHTYTHSPHPRPHKPFTHSPSTHSPSTTAHTSSHSGSSTSLGTVSPVTGTTTDTSIHSGSSASSGTVSPVSGTTAHTSSHSGSSASSGTVSPITGTTSLSPSLSSEIFHPPGANPTPLGPGSVHAGNGSLSQAAQNGNSPLGSFGAPKLPPYLNGTSGLGFPTTVVPRGATLVMPTTGVTRSYNFDIARATIAPDGVERPVILVNGAFPGPTIEANWGDTIQVTVTNNIVGPEEGTAMHWHGLLQTGTPYMDGVPGIGQCPIAPGQTLTYSFVADLYGTSWWHSHYSAQYSAGIEGAMIIYGPKTAAYDIDLGPVLLSDYYHRDYFSILEDVMGTNLSIIAPFSVNNVCNIHPSSASFSASSLPAAIDISLLWGKATTNDPPSKCQGYLYCICRGGLINGKGQYDCSLVTDGSTCTSNAGYSKFQFQTGKTHRLRLINSGAEGIQKFSIDSHVLTVVAVDFVPVVPYQTTIVTLGIGQRTDVLVTANLTSASSVWMRSTLSSCSLASQPDGLAMVYYPNASTSAVPTSQAFVDNTNPCANDDLSTEVPYFPLTPTTSPAVTTDISVNFEINSTGNFLWTMNNSSFRVDYNDPILFLANQGNDSYPYDPEWNVYDFGKNTSMRFVVENLTPVAHPMHLHGHNMYILAEGLGSWDGTIVNPSNPTRRDVRLLQPSGYMVMQFDADNPGVWPFHCHIAWHVSGGLYVNILERPDLITQLQIPSSIENTCTSWSAYTSADTVDQIDSGLRVRALP